MIDEASSAQRAITAQMERLKWITTLMVAKPQAIIMIIHGMVECAARPNRLVRVQDVSQSSLKTLSRDKYCDTLQRWFFPVRSNKRSIRWSSEIIPREIAPYYVPRQRSGCSDQVC